MRFSTKSNDLPRLNERGATKPGWNKDFRNMLMMGKKWNKDICYSIFFSLKRINIKSFFISRCITCISVFLQMYFLANAPRHSLLRKHTTGWSLKFLCYMCCCKWIFHVFHRSPRPFSTVAFAAGWKNSVREREWERESILVGELYHSFGLPERKLDLFHNCNVNKQKTDQLKRSEWCNIITIFLLPHLPSLSIFIWGEVINICLVKKIHNIVGYKCCVNQSMTEWPQQNIKVIHSNFAPTVKGWKEVDSGIDRESMECDISVTWFSTNRVTACSMGHELIYDVLY